MSEPKRSLTSDRLRNIDNSRPWKSRTEEGIYKSRLKTVKIGKLKKRTKLLKTWTKSTYILQNDKLINYQVPHLYQSDMKRKTVEIQVKKKSNSASGVTVHNGGATTTARRSSDLGATTKRISEIDRGKKSGSKAHTRGEKKASDSEDTNVRKTLKPKTEILLTDIFDVKYVGKMGAARFVFMIVTTDRQIFLRSTSKSDSMDWVEKISGLVEERRSIAMQKESAVESVLNVRRSGRFELGEELDTVFEDTEYFGKVDRGSFEKVRLIGEGSYGKVFLVEKRDSGKYFAMKVLDKNHVKKKRQVKRVLFELKVMSIVDHPFLMRLHYGFQTKKKMYLIMDFANGGELFHHLEIQRQFSEERARFYAAEIILALEYLHDSDIMYRDLKPENIILGNDGHVLLTDFGFAKSDINDETGSICGTMEYVSPEMINGRHNKTVDWWALGMLLYEMLSGQPAFEESETDSDDERLFYRIENEEIAFPEHLSPEAISIISQLCHKDLGQRLVDPVEIKKHEFFESIDWERLVRKEITPPYVPHVLDETDVQYIDSEFKDRSISASTTMTERSDDSDGFEEFFYRRG